MVARLEGPATLAELQDGLARAQDRTVTAAGRAPCGACRPGGQEH